LAALAAADVKDHALAVDIIQLQVHEFGAAQAGGVEGHQQGSMKRVTGCIDESRDFLLAEDRGEAMGLLRIRSLGDAPGFLECLDIEKTQGREANGNCTWRQLPLLK